MKKQYINPNVRIKQIKPNNILAGSPDIESSGSATEGGSTVDGNNTGNGGNGMAKSSWGDCWDDIQ